MTRLTIASFYMVLTTAGASMAGTTADEEAALMERARDLAKKFLIVDTHVDLPYRLNEHPEDVSVRTERGEMDFVRAKEGGLNAPFMSIYTPADLQEQPGASKAHADRMIDLVEGLVAKSPDKFAIATSPAHLRAQFAKGVISFPLGMENGSPLEDDIVNLAHFFRRGIRYITLAHSKDNRICDSSYDTAHTWKGLTPFGREVVVAMNRYGIMIDVSHVSDDTFWQVMDLSEAPVIASHSSCRKFTPGFERNIGDDMIKRLAAAGGVVMINFGSSFINDGYRTKREALREEIRAVSQERGWQDDSDEAREYAREVYRRELTFADVTDVADHIDHVVALAGIDYVGFGSDFDGVGDSLPTGLKDVSQYPNLIAHLLKRGYDEAAIEKICSGNILRVWAAVEAHARRAAGEAQGK